MASVASNSDPHLCIASAFTHGAIFPALKTDWEVYCFILGHIHLYPTVHVALWTQVGDTCFLIPLSKVMLPFPLDLVG